MYSGTARHVVASCRHYPLILLIFENPALGLNKLDIDGNIIDHRCPPITTYHSYPIGNPFQREKMLEGFGGFNMESRLGEGSEKRGIAHNKAVKERGVRGVAERGMWRKRVV